MGCQMIDPKEAAKVCRQIERNLSQVPEHVLIEAKRRMEIEAHNAEVERKKTEKRRDKAMLKEMGIRRNVRNKKYKV